jgi:hypothetical protein
MELKQHVDDTISSRLSNQIYGLGGAWWYWDELGYEIGPFETEEDAMEHLTLFYVSPTKGSEDLC